ncbi:hypothetical protein GCM10007881_15880 [Mesorhizobium huakuii]|nr:hypothetical protein GCM10007881_15880 [Mesorhizobium huakuii]
MNWISYELCVLTQLRDRIRSKEIWVVGADRYRNPDDDLPRDFEIRRDAYYTAPCCMDQTLDEATLSTAFFMQRARTWAGQVLSSG